MPITATRNTRPDDEGNEPDIMPDVQPTASQRARMRRTARQSPAGGPFRDESELDVEGIYARFNAKHTDE